MTKKFDLVLSDDDLLGVYRSLENPKHDRDSVIEAMGAAVDAAMSKLAEQEPVAWVHPTDPTRSITHHQKLGAIKDGGAIEKTTRVFSIPAYAHPIPSCQGLLDSSITPLAQRKIQTLLDKGEYRVIENATVLVNENGHAAIVNKGGAFYWVDNEALAREFDGVGVVVDSHHIADKRKMVADMYWISDEFSTETILDAFDPIVGMIDVSVGDTFEVKRAKALPSITVEVTEMTEYGDVKAYKIVGGDHIPDGGKMVDDADEALRDALDLVGLDMGAYSSPKEALSALIDWHVSVSTDPRTNGGWQLVPVEPTENQIISAMEASLLGKPSVDDDTYVMSIIESYLSAAPKFGENEHE